MTKKDDSIVMKQPSVRERNRRFKLIMNVPAVLHLPSKVAKQLNRLCKRDNCSPEVLVFKAIKSQSPRFDEFTKEVVPPLKPGEAYSWPPGGIWPKDPLYVLAWVAMFHFTRRYWQSFTDPAGFEEQNKRAPAEWSFKGVAYDPAIPWVKMIQ